jgi:hypothetical protein
LRAQLGFITAPQNWNFIEAAASADETLVEGRRLLGL